MAFFCLYLPYLTSFAHIVYRLVSVCLFYSMCNSVLLYVSNCFALSWPGRNCKRELVLNLPTWLNKDEINTIKQHNWLPQTHEEAKNSIIFTFNKSHLLIEIHSWWYIPPREAGWENAKCTQSCHQVKKNIKLKIYFDLFNPFLITTWFHVRYFIVLILWIVNGRKNGNIKVLSWGWCAALLQHSYLRTKYILLLQHKPHNPMLRLLRAHLAVCVKNICSTQTPISLLIGLGENEKEWEEERERVRGPGGEVGEKEV
jgi:hypothetical protein